MVFSSIEGKRVILLTILTYHPDVSYLIMDAWEYYVMTTITLGKFFFSYADLEKIRLQASETVSVD